MNFDRSAVFRSRCAVIRIFKKIQIVEFIKSISRREKNTENGADRVKNKAVKILVYIEVHEF